MSGVTLGEIVKPRSDTHVFRLMHGVRRTSDVNDNTRRILYVSGVNGERFNSSSGPLVPRVSGSLGLWVSWFWGLWVPGSLGPWVLGSLGLWVFGSLGLWVYTLHSDLFGLCLALITDC